MKAGPVEREIAAWGPIVDRLADLTIGHQHGHLTTWEYARLRGLYHWIFANTPAV